MIIDLQEQLPGETIEQFQAYELRRDSDEMTIERWHTDVYKPACNATGRKNTSKSLKTIIEWAETFRWVERVIDYNRPLSVRISEVVNSKRLKESPRVAERTIDGLLRIQAECEQVLSGHSDAMTVQSASRLMHENLSHIEKVFKLDFDFIEDKAEVLHHSPIVSQIWDIIGDKIPKDRSDFLICPIKDELKTLQSKTNIEFLVSDEREILCSGPVNCGKTIICLLYNIALHCAIPGFQSMILRTEAKSIYNTILPQLFNKILKLPPKDPRQPFTLYGGDKRPLEINWKNGGTTYFGGFDNSEKIRGTEMDLVFHSQLEREASEASYLDLIGRVEGGRAGNWFLNDGLPFNQIIGDANPGSPHHWLKGREKNEQLKFFNFQHEDNAALYYNFDLTPQGKITVEGLKKRYVGYMLERMVYGNWVGASGLVYPMFSKKDHVKHVTKDDIPSDWSWFLTNDYGGRAPFCYQLWAVAPTRDKFIMLREIYHTQWDLEEQIAMLNNAVINNPERGNIGKENIKAMFVEHVFEHNKRFEKEKIHIILADKTLLGGLEQCKGWLSKPDAIIFNSNSLVHPPDPDLLDTAHSTVQEFLSYTYKEEGSLTGSRQDEEPIKKFDHGMDAFRYLLSSLLKVNYIPDFSGSTYKVKSKQQHVF